MRRTAILTLSIVAGLASAGCSKQTQDNAEKTAESAGKDVGADSVKASEAISGAAVKASEAVDRIGSNIKEGADESRARAHEKTNPDKDR